MAQFCKQRAICALTKYYTQCAHKALQLLVVPPAWFHSYTLDFIIDLFPAWGFNCILTVIYHLTKLMYLIPCTMDENRLPAAQVAKLVFENNVWFFGVPKELVHDLDPRFTAQL